MTVPTNQDLRTVLVRLREHDELATVKGEVDWDRELGTLTREALRRKAPALQFDDIVGYNQPDARCGQLVTSLLASPRRLSLLLGFDTPPSQEELIKFVLAKNAERVPPVLVGEGPVHDVVVEGADVDLTELPVPW